MEVKTKYSIGQYVWFMHNNHVNEGRIQCAKIEINGGNKDPYWVEVTYNGTNGLIGIDERRVFASKEELLKSL